MSLWRRFYGITTSDAEEKLAEERRARERREMLRQAAARREAALVEHLERDAENLDELALGRYVAEIERIRASSNREEGDALQNFRDAMREPDEGEGEEP